MISVVIEAPTGPATINVRFDDSISADELRAAWQDISSGMLQRHIYDAIWFDCVRRGMEPRQVLPELPGSNVN
jgi:hypothetical protein